MMGSVSIDTSVEALWNCWQRFSSGKRRTPAFERFRYDLEANLRALSEEAVGEYRHGSYATFTVRDPKCRLIAVAPIRDRLIHRLLYENLVARFDDVFLYDVWSCRQEKGLLRAIHRAQAFLHSFPRSWVWRADIARFFESVDHALLRRCLRRRVTDERTWFLLDQVIDSYPSLVPSSNLPPQRGIPIGNVTSQVFANILLHELDRFVVHTLRPLRYLRYGDDFLSVWPTRADAEAARSAVSTFLRADLRLRLHPRNDVIVPARAGVRFCGYDIFHGGRRLKAGSAQRWRTHLRLGNFGSYAGLVRSEGCARSLRAFHWRVLQCLERRDSLPHRSR
jgi:RNA-directed DNA polymerase